MKKTISYKWLSGIAYMAALIVFAALLVACVALLFVASSGICDKYFWHLSAIAAASGAAAAAIARLFGKEG